MSFRWDEKTWKEIDQRKPQVVLLPLGSTEAHGPHLPLATDSLISGEMAQRAAVELSQHQVHALVLPCLDYAITDYSRDFSGTISIRKETFQNLLRDISDQIAELSIGLLCIVNSHLEPEHIQAIQEFAHSYKKLKVLFPDKTKKPWGSLLTAEFKEGACHAGSYETSLVLRVREDLVNENRKELPENKVNLAQLMKAGVKNFRQAGANEAYFGNPAAATKEEGEETYRILTRMIVETVLREIVQSKPGPDAG
jgi:creatinine amidohydrolase